MPSLNKVQIIGNLARDVELRYTQSGLPVANMTVSTNESYTDKEGNKVEKAEFHRVTCFQRVAESCTNYLAKGSLVYVEGSLTTRKWQDQQGQDRYTTEIKADRVQFLDRKGDQGGEQQPAHGAPRQQSAPRQNAQRRAQNEDLRPRFPSEGTNMDEVPF